MGTQELTVGETRLQLLPEKAVYVEAMRSLLVSDVHLGKSETFQRYGVPVSSQVNQATLDRLQRLCERVKPECLWILGDLFHSQEGLVDEVIEAWLTFLNQVQVRTYLILGNHDRPSADVLSQLSLECFTEAVVAEKLVLSHEPCETQALNICGHLHPCLRLKTRLDDLRLPCFYWEPVHCRLTLPSFGEFTGGYEVSLANQAVAYGIAEDQIIPFTERGHPLGQT